MLANEQSILTQDVNVSNISRESLKLQQPEIGTVYAAKTKEVLGILEEIDEALHCDTTVTQSMIDDLHEVWWDGFQIHYASPRVRQLVCSQ